MNKLLSNKLGLIKLFIVLISLFFLSYFIFISPPTMAENGQSVSSFCKTYSDNYSIPAPDRSDVFETLNYADKLSKARLSAYNSCLASSSIDYKKLVLYIGFVVFSMVSLLFTLGNFRLNSRNLHP